MAYRPHIDQRVRMAHLTLSVVAHDGVVEVRRDLVLNRAYGSTPPIVTLALRAALTAELPLVVDAEGAFHVFRTASVRWFAIRQGS
jgi:hypothetical protein